MTGAPADIRPAPRRRVAAIVLADSALLTSTLVLFQAVMAGQVLASHRGALAAHELGAHSLMYTTLIALISGIIAWLRGQVAG